VTLFNRGQTNPELFPEVEKLRGDREGDLARLRGRSFDSCVDVNTSDPDWVRRSVAAVEAPFYLYVSSISAYADLSVPVDEGSPTSDQGDEYGELKAECEKVALTRPGAVVRPGLIVGPHDLTGRFTYWPHRIARGGDVLAPGSPDDQVQIIDVRDLGEWIAHLCEEQTTGVFNAVRTFTRSELLDACIRATGSSARLVLVPSEWLLAQGVGEWMELPLWIVSPEYAGMMLADNRRAVAAGLKFRPLDDTARATLAGAATTDDAGLKPEREAELLAEWASLASGK
jgi:2'-hydroxyisoflavone reductase